MRQALGFQNSLPRKHSNRSKFSIPIPTTNGLDTYSIVHYDHTLIIDVDHNGNVRRQEVINRLGQEKEEIIAMITQQLLQWVKKKEEELNVIIIVQNKAFFQLLLGIFQQLILNLPDNINSLLEVSGEKAILDYGSLNVYVGRWDERVVSFGGNNSLIIFEFSENTVQNITQVISKALSKNVFTHYAILFEEKIIQQEKGKRILKEISSFNQKFQFLDMSDTERALLSIFSLLRAATT